MAGSEREGRFDEPPPPGEAPTAPDGGVSESPLDQTIAAYLGQRPGGMVLPPPGRGAASPADVDEEVLEVLSPADEADTDEATSPWAAWAASMAGPASPDVSPEALAFGTDAQGDDAPIGEGLFGSLVSSLLSMLIHLAALILLGLWITTERDPSETALVALLVHRTTEADQVSELETLLLDENLAPGSQAPLEVVAAPEPSSEPWEPDQSSLADLIALSDSAISSPQTDLAGIWDRLNETRPATSGTAHASVNDYRQALDHITEEILRIAAKEKALIIWCFDQSGSMKDDQQEIQARLERVYAELGATGVTSSDAVMTAVTSFGREFFIHTEHPTTDLDAIRKAIDEVPVDSSGDEMMCSAIIRSVGIYHNFARRQRRRMALVLVSDESGDIEESETYLEAAIGQAVAARCKVYILGRESVFGYPLAHIRWVHPETEQVHELPIDRGPETAFLEVLGTDGFGPRSDAQPSGFGPYGQSRLAWRTGGIFFMLPSMEADLVGGEQRRYDSVTMRPYRPDLRSREEIVVDAQRHPLRPITWKIVNDLSPLQLKTSRMMNLDRRFPADMSAFKAETRVAQMRSGAYLAGLDRGVKALDTLERARDREPSRRCQANYDLLRAQLVGYTARVRLYRMALDGGVNKAGVTPRTIPPDKALVGWRIRDKRETPSDETTVELLERSIELYLAVLEEHPQTPWAARAEWELNRDFGYPLGAATDGEAGTRAGAGSGGSTWGLAQYTGVEMVPEYRSPPKRPQMSSSRTRPQSGPGEPPPTTKTIPIPRL